MKNYAREDDVYVWRRLLNLAEQLDAELLANAEAHATVSCLPPGWTAVTEAGVEYATTDRAVSGFALTRPHVLWWDWMDE